MLLAFIILCCSILLFLSLIEVQLIKYLKSGVSSYYISIHIIYYSLNESAGINCKHKDTSKDMTIKTRNPEQ